MFRWRLIMREKNIIIICITMIICVSIISATVLKIHYDDNNKSLNNSTNKTNGTINKTENYTNNTTTINSKTSSYKSNSNTKSSSTSSKSSVKTKPSSTNYVGEGGRDGFTWTSNNYKSNGHVYRDMKLDNGKVVSVQQD